MSNAAIRTYARRVASRGEVAIRLFAIGGLPRSHEIVDPAHPCGAAARVLPWLHALLDEPRPRA